MSGSTAELIKELIKELILSENISEEHLNEIAKLPTNELIRGITNFSAFPIPRSVGSYIREEHQIDDSLTAPYYVYIPKSYDPATKIPLVVWLHGGVSRNEFIDDINEYFDEHFIINLAEEEGWLVLAPLGRLNLTWWDKAGMENVNWQIRKLRQSYNIDGNRIIMGGFSDGGSGSYHYAFLQPDDFALFFPWSGRPDVGTQVSGSEAFIPNLRSNNQFAVNGGRDGLYPAAKLMPLMRYIIDEVDVEMSFTVYDTAKHDWSYIPEESAFMVDRVRSVRRNLYPSKIYWECTDLDYGKNSWLNITELDTSLDRADWHKEFNYTMTDDRITIGFMADRSFEGEGVRVESLSKSENSPAIAMGLLAGDLVIGMDGNKIVKMQDLGNAKSKTKRGNKMVIRVMRDGSELDLTTMIPDATEYEAFPRNTPSGAVEVVRVGNSIFIKSSRVSQLEIYLHPNMVRLDQPMKIIVNDKKVFDLLVIPDTRLLLAEYLKNRDRRMLWTGRILVNVN